MVLWLFATVFSMKFGTIDIFGGTCEQFGKVFFCKSLLQKFPAICMVVEILLVEKGRPLLLYSYNLTRTVTFGRVSEVSNTMRVTSGGVWNVDPWLLWWFNCVIKRRGLDMWESVRNLPCCAPLVFSLFEAHDSLCLLSVGEAWMTALVVCTLSHLRRSNVSSEWVQLVLDNLCHLHPLWTQCCT